MLITLKSLFSSLMSNTDSTSITDKYVSNTSGSTDE